MGHIPGHTHIPTNIKVAVLLVEHAEHLAGQPLPQDVLNIDLKPEEMVGPGPCCRGAGGWWRGEGRGERGKPAVRTAGQEEAVRGTMGCRVRTLPAGTLPQGSGSG